MENYEKAIIRLSQLGISAEKIDDLGVYVNVDGTQLKLCPTEVDYQAQRYDKDWLTDGESVRERFPIGSRVSVEGSPDFNHDWEGSVENYKEVRESSERYVQVIDGEGDVWDIEPEYLIPVED